MRRRCRQCKNHNIPKDAPRTQFVCGVECATAYGKDRAAKLRTSTARAVRAKDKAHKQKAKEFKQNDYRRQFQLTKRAAQVLANRLDVLLPCICCDEPRGSAQFCGGHFKTVGGHPEAALDLRNIHGQRNRLCNMEKSGNISGDKHSKGFRQGLIDRYGIQLVEYLDAYKPAKKYTCQDLIALRKTYAAEIRLLEKGLPPSCNWRELPVPLSVG